MSNFTIEIVAPTIVAVIEKLITAIAPRTAIHAQLPQTPAEQATRQQVVPAPTYAPAPAAPANPTTPVQYAQPNRPASAPAQAVHTVAPTVPISPTQAYSAAPAAQPPMYAAPAQQYQPAPVNPVPTAPIPGNPPMGAVNMAPAAIPAPANNAPIASPSNQVPVAAAPAYQIDDLARAASQLMDAGKQQDLIALLGQFSVQALTQLPKEQFGAFATALRQMGAKL